MCMLCSNANPTDPLAAFDKHGAESGSGVVLDGSDGGQSSPPVSLDAAAASGGAPDATYTWDQIAGQLTDGYWAWSGYAGTGWRAFDIGVDRELTFSLVGLSAAEEEIARAAVDAMSRATGITFVEVAPPGPVVYTQFTETSDVLETTGSLFSITGNSETNGTIGSTTDEDWYRISMVAGQSYVIELNGTGGGIDPFLRVRDSAGNILAENDDAVGLNSSITFTAPTSGTYFIEADSFGDSTGSYELRVTEGSSAQITFVNTDTSGAYASAVTSGNEILSSIVNIPVTWDELNLNGYMLQTYIHELGHALGLGHAGNYNGGAVWGTDNLYDNDSWAASIMSYFSQTDNTFFDGDLAYLATLMPADIIALHNLYGFSGATNAGATTYGFNSNMGGYLQDLLNMWTGAIAVDTSVYDSNPIAFTIFDSNGIDTVNFSNFTMAQTIQLRELIYSSVGGLAENMIIARGTVIENARGGSGNDIIGGNAAANGLSGNAGADSLYGGGAGDNLWGGTGADAHFGGNDAGVDYARYDDANYGNLVIRLDAPGANTGAAAGDSYDGIEGLVGGAGNDTVIGNALNNYLFGSGGADLVYGGVGNDYLSGDAGGDNLWGGAGADAHYGGNDGVDYARYDDANWGNLTLRLDNAALNAGAAAVGDTYTGIEGLVGGAGADVIIGNSAANWLFGSGGADYIDGLAGYDYLNGGAGADRFRFSTALSGTNVDQIADFQHLVDDILLVQSIFAGIGPTLTADEFRIGMAQDANDRILYNNGTGQLYYDSNANVAGGMMLFATVTAGTVLTFDDFVMV
jgi:hypothetical protein